MEWLILLLFTLIVYIVSNNIRGRQTKIKQHNLRQQNIDNANLIDKVICPKCLSTQISANKQGFTFSTLFVGSNNVWITCLQCGHRWKAGK